MEASIPILTGKEDECETASEIYQCGRDENLPIMDQIYTAEKGSATVVRTLSFFTQWRSNLYL
jgi:hypothetical protein